MSELFRKLQWLFRRRQFESDLEEEMQHHLALQSQDIGDTHAANRHFGNIELLKENSRAMWTFTFWEQFAQDIRYGFRTMASNRLFTAMAVLSLALGIGANTAIYSFMHAILLSSLPVQHPEQLVILNWHATGGTPVVHSLNGSMFRDGKVGRVSPNFPYAAYDILRRDKQTVSSLFAYVAAYQLNLVARNQAQISRGLYVSGNFAAGLGMRPALGRFIGDEDDRAGGPHVAAISYDYWKLRFASDPGAVGRTILIDTLPFTVIGVTPPGFYGIDSSSAPSVFLPLHAFPVFSLDPAKEEARRFFDPNFYWLEMMGRLQPGVTVAQAQAAFGGAFHNFVLSTALTPKEKQSLPELRAETGSGGLNSLRRQYSKPLYVLMAMVGLILVIACANIANLLLARATARRREIAIRLSLGAGRARVIRQLLTESVLLSLSGGALGILVALWAIRSIAWLLSDGREGMVLRAPLDWPVLGFTAALALITGIVFGLAPAFQATGGPVSPALKQARIGGAGESRFSLSHILVVAQIAISLMLVVAASLFVRTLANLHSVNLGFNRENILLFSVNAREAGYKDAALITFYSGLTERFRHIPGVQSVGLSHFPVVAGYWDDVKFTIRAPATTGRRLETSILHVNQDFLGAMQIPILLGRSLSKHDMEVPRSIVVTQLFASKFLPGQNPIGRHIGIGDHNLDVEIVGVAKTSLYNSIREETPPLVYIPYTADPVNLQGVWFELRTSANPLASAAEIRRAVHEASPAVPVTSLKTQAAQIDQTLSSERTFADLCTCFAVLALLIAGVGLYGTMAYAVARRTSEVGIRIALGAQRGKILWMMLRQVLMLAVAGLAIGLIAAWQTTHFVASFLFGLRPEDPMALWGSAAILLLSTLIAGFGPARKATRVNPMVALRNE